MHYLYKKILATGATALTAAIVFSLASSASVFAAYSYNPSDLISDGIFTNVSSMGSSSGTAISNIQTFLNNEGSGIAHLNDTESCNPTTPPSSSTNPYTYSYTYYQNCGKTESAADIIYEAGRAYGINPQAIMATMQKEQSLITDPSPSSSQINCAMGYNSCSGFVGFFNQVDNATWQLRTDLDLMNGNNWWGYAPSSYPCSNSTSLYSTGLYPGRNVKFNDPGGTAETVTLQSSATAALYCYTPYVGPYSTTGYSGSYNFVQSFEQWWGSTLYPFAGEVTVNTYSDAAMTQPLSLSGPFLSGQKIYVKVSAVNTGSNQWNSAWTHIGTANPYDRSSPFQDSSWLSSNRAADLQQQYVWPTYAGTFEYSMTTPNIDGNYNEDFQLIADGQTGGWMQDDASFGFNIDVSNPFNGAITQLGTYEDSNYTQPIDPTAMTPGQKVYVKLQVQNIGTQTWSNSFTHIATTNPQDRSSVFQDSSWLSSNRPAGLVQSSVPPGQTGTFEFSITAPGTTGTYNESFGMVADGQTGGWMPNPSFTFNIHDTNPPVSTLYSGEKLYPGNSIQSQNGDYTLDMQTDGNLVIDTPNGPLWGSNTNGQNVAYVVNQDDGNLVMYNASGQPIWASGTSGQGQSNLYMQNDGNLVMYNASGQATWGSGTNINSMNTPSSLQPGATLQRGSELISPNNEYHVVLQNDGNLVVYSPAHALWGASRVGSGATFLAMQTDGNLVLYNGNSHPIWATGTNSHGNSTLVMQNDGNLVIYDANHHAVWGSGTSGKW